MTPALIAAGSIIVLLAARRLLKSRRAPFPKEPLSPGRVPGHRCWTGSDPFGDDERTLEDW